MPNWKKLITSGSSGSLAHLSVDTSVEASSFTGSLLSTNGVISSSGNLVSGELVYSTGGSSVSSSNLVYLDTANERVGIKTSSPQYPFHYVQDTGNALAVYEKQGGAAIFYEAQDTRGALGTVASHPLLFAINSAEVSRINTSGVYEGDVSGSIYATNGVLSSSAQIATDISGSITSTSSSIASDIATLVSFSSSLETTIYDYTGSFTGDGSGLTGVQSTVTEQVTLVDSFTSATTHSIAHTFATKNLNVTLYDENDDVFIPTRINTPTTSSVVIYMDPATTGRAVISKGGHIVSGSIAVSVVSSSTVSDTFTSATTHSVAHTFGTKDVFVTVYDSNDDVFIPTRISTPTTSSVTVYMDPATTGRVVIGKAGHIVSGSADYTVVGSDITGLGNLTVSGSILPHTTEVFDLGSADKRWKDLYLSGSTIDLGGTKITRDASTGDIEFLDSESNRKSIKVDELQIGTGASARKIKVNNGRIQFTDTSDVVESTETGDIIPSATNTYDLGSPSAQFRHLYLSTASLYMDGTKVLSSTADVLTFTTDVGQSIKLLETGGDDIILQTGEGNIELKGTVEILTGRKIIDSGGTQVVFGDGIYVEGNIGTTGTVDGIDLQAFSASVSTSLANSTADYTELTNIPSGIISGAAQLPSGIISGSSQLPSGLVSGSTQIDNLGFLKVTGDSVVSGSAQITSLLNSQDLTLNNLTVNGTTTTVNSTTLDIGDNIISLNGIGAAKGGLAVNDGPASGSLLWDGTNNYWVAGPTGSEVKVLLATGDSVVSGSAQVDYNSIQNKPTIPTNNNQLTNGAGYITSYTDTNYYLDGITKSGNTLTFSVNGATNQTYTFGANAFTSTTIPTNNNQLSNGAGYITGITSGDVTTALGYTPWHSGNDGAGSGLDADTLDSYQESSFVRLAASTSSPTNGNFAIGSASSRNFIQSHGGQPLDINPLGNAVTIGGTSNTAWHAGNDGAGSGLDADLWDGNQFSTYLNQAVLTTSAVTFSTVTATSLTETSALRFKENIQEDLDTSIIDKLRPVSFDWKEDGNKDYGFIAEEVNELDNILTTKDENDQLLGIKYTKLIPFLVKKIQEQEERIKQLENGNS